MKRIFLIVLDSFGIGAMPDAEKFGDVNVNTLRSCAGSDKLKIPNMISAGLGNIDGVTCLPKTDAPKGAYARLTEASMGKDTTIGHWEIAGIVSPDPLPTFPKGFPKDLLDNLAKPIWTRENGLSTPPRTPCSRWRPMRKRFRWRSSTTPAEPPESS